MLSQKYNFLVKTGGKVTLVPLEIGNLEALSERVSDYLACSTDINQRLGELSVNQDATDSLLEDISESFLQCAKASDLEQTDLKLTVLQGRMAVEGAERETIKARLTILEGCTVNPSDTSTVGLLGQIREQQNQIDDLTKRLKFLESVVKTQADTLNNTRTDMFKKITSLEVAVINSKGERGKVSFLANSD